MANRTVTLTGTNVGADVATVDIYHTSAIAGNIIANNVTKAQLVAGYSFVDDDAHTTYIIKADSPCATTATINFGVTQNPGDPEPVATLTPTTTPTLTGTTFYRSTGLSLDTGFCQQTYNMSLAFYGGVGTSTVPSLMGTTVYSDRNLTSPLNGSRLYFAVSTLNNDQTGLGNEPFYIIQIASNGLVEDVIQVTDCNQFGSGPGGGGTL